MGEKAVAGGGKPGQWTVPSSVLARALSPGSVATRGGSTLDPGRVDLGPGADAKEGVGYSKRFNAPEAHLSAMQPPPHAGIGPPLAPAEERIGARGKNNACSGTVFKVD